MKLLEWMKKNKPLEQYKYDTLKARYERLTTLQMYLRNVDKELDKYWMRYVDRYDVESEEQDKLETGLYMNPVRNEILEQLGRIRSEKEYLSISLGKIEERIKKEMQAEDVDDENWPPLPDDHTTRPI